MRIQSKIIIEGIGNCFYSDGNEMFVESYNGNVKNYNCGREYIKPDISKPFS